MLHGRAPSGPRLGAISNAGFESVAFADNVGVNQRGETVFSFASSVFWQWAP